MEISEVLGSNNKSICLFSPKFKQYSELIHGFTLRLGGYSFGSKQELNLEEERKRLEVEKYCKFCKKHTTHKETK